MVLKGNTGQSGPSAPLPETFLASSYFPQNTLFIFWVPHLIANIEYSSALWVSKFFQYILKLLGPTHIDDI